MVIFPQHITDQNCCSTVGDIKIFYGNYSKIPPIWLNKDKNCPKKGLFSRISGIEECPKWKKYNYEIYFLQLEANKFVLDSITVLLAVAHEQT